MTTTKPTKFEQTHIAMVLDRSGSMESCRKATIDAVNKYLLEARQDANMKEADFELLTFDSQSIDTMIPTEQVCGYRIKAGYYRRPVSWHAWYALVRDTMRIKSIFLKSVVFIGYTVTEDDEERFCPEGTAFLVSIHELGQKFDHLVTAAHVIEAIKKKGKQVEIRVNQIGGNLAAFGQCDPNLWLPHADSTVDVAVTPVSVVKLSVNTDTLAVVPIPLDKWVLTDELAEKADLMTGAPIATVGLFFDHPGHTHNLPVARQGTIALMRDPDNPVHTDRGYMDAYLAEVRSLDGLSGAPVFLMIEPFWVGEGRQLKSAVGQDLQNGYLLGMMHGHYELPPKGERETNKNDPDGHAGIGVVTPVDKILETINRTELKEARRLILEEQKKRRKKDGATVREDRSSRGKTVPKTKAVREADGEDVHRERFNRLKALATRSPKSSG